MVLLEVCVFCWKSIFCLRKIGGFIFLIIISKLFCLVFGLEYIFRVVEWKEVGGRGGGDYSDRVWVLGLFVFTVYFLVRGYFFRVFIDFFRKENINRMDFMDFFCLSI